MMRSIQRLPTLLYIWHTALLCYGLNKEPMTLPMNEATGDDDKPSTMSRLGAIRTDSSDSAEMFNDIKNDNDDDVNDNNDDKNNLNDNNNNNNNDNNNNDELERRNKSSALRNRRLKSDKDDGGGLLVKTNVVRKRSIRNGLVTSSTNQNASSPRILIRMAERSQEQFEYELTDNLAGFIQTSGYKYWKLFTLVDDWHHETSVIGPLDHVVVISILNGDVQCPLQRIEIYTGSEHNTSAHLETTLCAMALGEPNVLLYHQHFFHMHWKLHTELNGEHVSQSIRGFRLRFSFHKNTSPFPRELADGLWNCSLPNFAEFFAHFGCNYETQCLMAEDESNCSYTGNCQPGQLDVLGRCYAFKIPRQPISWLEANLACKKEYGAYLVSLNSAEEWTGVVAALRRRTSHIPLLVGLKGTGIGKPNVYQYQKEWADGTLAIYLKSLVDAGDLKTCGLMTSIGFIVLSLVCTAPEAVHYLCELQGPDTISIPRNSSTSNSPPETSNEKVIPFPNVTCPRGHATHTFLICDTKSACFPPTYGSSDDLDGTLCSVELDPLPPSFVCRSGGDSVAYSLVCDHRADCGDISDEDFCVFKPCSQNRLLYCGSSKQCVSREMICDGELDCANESDERDCSTVDESRIFSTKAPPALVQLYRGHSRRNEIKLRVTKSDGKCPYGFFECHVGGYCLQLVFRCNGVYDCPGREDEAWCSDYTCRGLYRCRDSQICLPPWELCDGYPLCPQFDDELFCDLICPPNCTCYGLAFFCPTVFAVHQFPDCRYLDASDSGMTTQDLVHNTMLVFLSLARCDLARFGNITLPNLIHLDLKDNNLNQVAITQLKHLSNLRVLLLAGNPLTTPAAENTELYDLLLTLRSLDLSRVALPVLHINKKLPHLQRLNLSATGVDYLMEPGFALLTGLHVLDLRGCPLSNISRQLFQGLYQLRSVYADTYRICCQAALPAGFNINNCRAPINSLSSCERLLKNYAHFVLLATFAIICIVGNTLIVVLQVFVLKNIKESAFSVLLCHLCVSDFVMGVYLSIIGFAYHVYVDSYLWEDVTWRHSGTCKLAGFLFLVASEVSAFILFAITLKNMAVFQSSLNWQMTYSAARLTGLVCWLCGLALATLPFVLKQGQTFTASGLCIPIPFTAASHGYFHNVIIFFSVLHMLVLSLQTVIHFKTRPNIMASLEIKQSSSEASETRRFVPVALSRSVCWVSLGFVGWTVCHGDSDCSEIKGTMGVVGIHLTSVLQPLMYVYGMWRERQQKHHQERVMQFILAKKRARDLNAKGLAGQARNMKHSER